MISMPTNPLAPLLVHLLTLLIAYCIHMLLESNQYIRCVLIDFSKAFDMVDHAILARKLQSTSTWFCYTLDHLLYYR